MTLFENLISCSFIRIMLDHKLLLCSQANYVRYLRQQCWIHSLCRRSLCSNTVCARNLFTQHCLESRSISFHDHVRVQAWVSLKARPELPPNSVEADSDFALSCFELSQFDQSNSRLHLEVRYRGDKVCRTIWARS
jgi:hypothetical protein